ncbi:23S rRNA accumulation protein YceD [Pseudaeromonas sharmana]|uniref:Large ribosomal RNA subunit accumulation protein YceD n=1 Tax=Pseudaeromonas sharmana TaxID=328412 RepID=A0ABV8CQB1_9GAMM
MQKVKLPIKIDPVRCAAKRLDYVGVVERAQFVRLAESVVDVLDDVDAELSFGTDAQGLTVMQGHAQALVSLECQRCGDAFNHQCDITFTYTPLTTKVAEDELPEAYEPIEVDENGEIDLHELLEDEIILSLPIAPMHAEHECKRGGMQMTWGKIEPADERPNPFAVLNSLKNK